MDADRLQSILDQFSCLTICVVGDFFLDKYLIVDRALSETSLETGLAAHQVVEVRCSSGAAGAVAANLRAMDVDVVALGVIGDDVEGGDLTCALEAAGVDSRDLIVRRDRLTPTYIKPIQRDRDGSARELNRLDIRSRAPLPASVEDELISRLRQIIGGIQGVVAVDQVPERNCGVITDRVRDEIAALARAYPTKVFAADSRERIDSFRDVILKPNAREAARALGAPGAPETEVDRAGAEAGGTELYRRSGKPVFLTVGAGGMIVFHPGGPTHVPAGAVCGPIDTVGAGDAAMAGIAAALCAGSSPPEAALVGNLAAAVAIHQVGTTGTARRTEIAESFTGWKPS